MDKRHGSDAGRRHPGRGACDNPSLPAKAPPAGVYKADEGGTQGGRAPAPMSSYNVFKYLMGKSGGGNGPGREPSLPIKSL